MDYTLNTEKSTLTWTGRKIGSSHTGTLDVSGSLTLEDGKVTSGRFTIDMNSMKNMDMEAGEFQDKLLTHLKSSDFFDVKQFPTGEIVITAVDNGKVTGKLTLKGKTHEITFDADISVDENTATAKAVFEIDRTLWEIKFGSGKFFKGLADKAIKDEIGIQLNLVAEKA
jgi:polyisoprenoid-binding protein YceI